MTTDKSARVVVAIVSPLPPPNGGIARWTERLLADIEAEPSVKLVIVNTALIGRGPLQLSFARRMWSGLWGTARTTYRLLKTLHQNRPDVVHVNSSGSLGLFRDLAVVTTARLSNTRCVLHLRFGRSPVLLSTQGWEGRLLTRVTKRATQVIAIDRPTAEAISSLNTAPVRLIPNYLAEGPRVPSEQPVARENTVGFFGHVHDAKGIGDLADAWHIVNSNDWSVELYGAVDPSYLSALRQRTAGLDFAYRGELTSLQVAQRLQEIGLLVLPSHTEGFPNILLEAMRASTPILATAVGAVPDMLADDAGIVVEPHDVAALAQAMSDIITDSARRQRIGANAHRRFRENYTAEAVIPQYINVWRESDI